MLDATRAAACSIVADPFAIEWIDPAIEVVTGIDTATWCDPSFWNLYLHPDDRHVIDRARSNALTGRPIVARVRIRDTQGVQLTLALCGYPSRRGARSPPRIAGYLVVDPSPLLDVVRGKHQTSSDVSEPVRSTPVLEQTAQLATKGELADGMLHDVRQPLTALHMDLGVATYLLRQTSPDVQAALRAIEDASADARRLSEVVIRSRRDDDIG